MKLYRKIDPRIEPQPKFLRWDNEYKLHILLNMQFLRFYNTRHIQAEGLPISYGDAPIVFYNPYLFKRALNRNTEYYLLRVEKLTANNAEYSQNRVLKVLESLSDHIRDEDKLNQVVEGLNRMLRNHIRKHKLWDLEYDIIQSKDLKNIPYSDYLRTEYRQKIKRIALSLHGCNCRICNSTKNIDMHHRKYENRGQYEKEIDDIIPLCRECHAKFHNK